jgi:hypothetical protein
MMAIIVHFAIKTVQAVGISVKLALLSIALAYCHKYYGLISALRQVGNIN